MEQPPSLLIWWMETLASYNFDMEFRSRTAHGNADALSRIQHVDADGKTVEIQHLHGAVEDLVQTTSAEQETKLMNVTKVQY